MYEGHPWMYMNNNKETKFSRMLIYFLSWHIISQEEQTKQ